MANPFEALYRAHNVPGDYCGPLAREFHDMIARKWLEGMCGGHTGPGEPEKLVRMHLSVDWQMRNGLTFARRGCDETHPLDWLQDRWCAFKRLFLKNPYKEPTP